MRLVRKVRTDRHILASSVRKDLCCLFDLPRTVGDLSPVRIGILSVLYRSDCKAGGIAEGDILRFLQSTGQQEAQSCLSAHTGDHVRLIQVRVDDPCAAVFLHLREDDLHISAKPEDDIPDELSAFTKIAERYRSLCLQ